MGRYKIIYADPAWSYKVWSEDKKVAQGTAKKHYQTMKIEDICNLPVADLADKDCKLFLWATPPCLPEAFRVMKAWGFEYKTIAFCWVKTNPKNGKPFYGIGHYTASNCELVLVSLRKGGKLNRQARNISQIDMSARREHSRKPDSIRDKIVRLCGDLPRVELFAREKAQGWDVWGNEVKSDISFDKTLEEKVGEVIKTEVIKELKEITKLDNCPNCGGKIKGKYCEDCLKEY